MELNDYSYGEIEIGKVFEFKRKLSQQDIDSFSNLTEDKNPLHTDKEYAKTTQFNGNIAHGMLSASLFSTLLGMLCPGKKNIYLSQTLNFKKPIYPDSELTIKGTIKSKTDSLKLITIKTEILVEDEVVLDGEALVRVME